MTPRKSVVALAAVSLAALATITMTHRIHAVHAQDSTMLPPDRPVEIERKDPSIDRIIPQGAILHTLAVGSTWTEGPVWISSKDGGYLLYAEIPSNSIRRVAPGVPQSIWLQPSGYKGTAPYGGPEPGTNGMTLDPQGRLTVAGHAARNIQRFESLNPHGPVTILADRFNGHKLNSPNDVVYGPDGSIYFTDPPYGLPRQGGKEDGAPVGVEQPVAGVYRLPGASKIPAGASPSRKLQLLIKDLPKPNGIAFSPDGRFLYISVSDETKRWMRYDVKRNGTLGEGILFFEAGRDKRPGGPDGIKIDSDGNLWGVGPAGVWIISPAGKPLGIIHLPKESSSVAFGGPDGKTLFITSADAVYSIQTNQTGMKPSTFRN